jgi:hypothetical protein
MEAPHVALPLKDSHGTIETTLLVSLGHFVVRHNTPTLAGKPPSKTTTDSFVHLADAALFDEYSITGKDIFAAVVDGAIDWPAVPQLTPQLLPPPVKPASSSSATVLDGSDSVDADEEDDEFLDAVSDFDEEMQETDGIESAAAATEIGTCGLRSSSSSSVFSRNTGPFSDWLHRLVAGGSNAAVAVHPLLGQFEMSGRLLVSGGGGGGATPSSIPHPLLTRRCIEGSPQSRRGEP